MLGREERGGGVSCQGVRALHGRINKADVRGLCGVLRPTSA